MWCQYYLSSSKLQLLTDMWYHRGIMHVQGLCFKLINIVVSLFVLLVVFSFEQTLVSNPSVGIWQLNDG